MVDSHCHLADEVFIADVADVVARAKAAGLLEALCVLDASDPAEFTRAHGVCEQWSRIRLAAGVHPHRAGAFAGEPVRAADLVRSRLDQEPLVRAIGEIGLDYHYTYAPRDVQIAVFSAQVALARERDLPVIIHTREADSDTIRVIEEIGQGCVRGVFHCFSGDRDLALKAIAMGFHVSFSGIVTFQKADRVREAAEVVPLDRLLVETDSPYLAPVPHRGKRNEPAWVVRVAEAVAAIHKVSPGELSEAVTRNYRDLFRP
ncbi:MAG: TatD family hydrolase [Acidobacteria bacterium]|nr:TatD family hydrolase [Acidobacteriota bacterium]